MAQYLLISKRSPQLTAPSNLSTSLLNLLQSKKRTALAALHISYAKIISLVNEEKYDVGIEVLD